MLRRWCMGYGYPCMKVKYLDGIPKLQESIRLAGISALRAKMKPFMTATINLFCRTTARGAARGWTVIVMRLIDADNVRNLFDAEFKETRKLILAGETHLDNLAEGFAEADRVIWQMPTVDAVPVVRCKDCLFRESGENECESWEWCKALHREMPPHAFCSLGVRKDDDDAKEN